MLNVEFVPALHRAGKPGQNYVFMFMGSSRVPGEVFGPYEGTSEGNNYILHFC